MKPIRQIFLFVVTALLILPATGLSQRGRMTVEERLKTLTEQLSLKPAQADSIKFILVSGDSARMKLFAEHRDDRSAMREAMQKLNEEQDKKIEALLTEEQNAKYLKIIEERKNRGPRPENRDSDKH
ncbi:MAG TPA: hypothetical protein VMW43_01385 [Bacteroidota bacterium]|nr:hypothetical protein [Bacteroidota bacterium]